jgi:predicted O-methyltransferase YrrM
MITNPEIERYIDELLPSRDPVLLEMEALAQEERIPIIGPQVATVLAQLVKLAGARRIFELGSAIGYSTIWLARAAGEGAEVHYSDGSEENASRARAFFDRAGIADRIRVHVGDALTCFGETEGLFDFVFNDVDKEGYPDVLEAVPVRLRAGGVFATDNALWHERVINPPDETSRQVVDFDQKMFNAKDFLSSLLPIRDGLLIGVKR